MEIKFTVPGRPKGKGRPRATISVHKLYGDAERLEIALQGEEAPR